MKTSIIGIVGCAKCEQEILSLAYETGKIIGKKGYILINGGLSGVMEYASRGAKEEGGLVIGILPTPTKSAANPYIDIPIVTGMNEARNVIIARTADVLIAIDGKFGTLSEIIFGLHFGKKVIGLKTSYDLPIIKVNTPEEAIKTAEKILNKKNLFS